MTGHLVTKEKTDTAKEGLGVGSHSSKWKSADFGGSRHQPPHSRATGSLRPRRRAQGATTRGRRPHAPRRNRGGVLTGTLAGAGSRGQVDVVVRRQTCQRASGESEERDGATR